MRSNQLYSGETGQDYGRDLPLASFEARLTRPLDAPSMQRTETLLKAREVIREHFANNTPGQIPKHVVDTMFLSMVEAVPAEINQTNPAPSHTREQTVQSIDGLEAQFDSRVGMNEANNHARTTEETMRLFQESQGA